MYNQLFLYRYKKVYIEFVHCFARPRPLSKCLEESRLSSDFKLRHDFCEFFKKDLIFCPLGKKRSEDNVVLA